MLVGCGAQGEQFELALLHLGNLLADVPHRLPAIALDDVRGRGFDTRVAAQFEDLAQLLDSQVQQLLDSRNRRALLLVVGYEPAQFADALVDQLHGGVVRPQIALIAGDDVAALAGFGILDRRDQRLERAEGLVGVGHPGRVVVQAHDLAVFDQSRDRDHGHDQPDADDQPGLPVRLHGRLWNGRRDCKTTPGAQNSGVRTYSKQRPSNWRLALGQRPAIGAPTISAGQLARRLDVSTEAALRGRCQLDTPERE